MPRKVSTTVYLSEEQAARLKALSAATHVPAAEYVRASIAALLPRFESEGIAPFLTLPPARPVAEVLPINPEPSEPA